MAVITVDIVVHRDTGLMLGTSKDMKGLYVHGRTAEELNRRIPLAIKEMLEAQGKTDVEVTEIVGDNDQFGFRPLETTRKFAAA